MPLLTTLVGVFCKGIALNTGEGITQWIKAEVEKVPIPTTTAEKQQDFIQRGDHILSTKDAYPKADTSALEADINQLVYGLYSLIPAEIKVVYRSI